MAEPHQPLTHDLRNFLQDRPDHDISQVMEQTRMNDALAQDLAASHGEAVLSNQAEYNKYPYNHSLIPKTARIWETAEEECRRVFGQMEAIQGPNTLPSPRNFEVELHMRNEASLKGWLFRRHASDVQTLLESARRRVAANLLSPEAAASDVARRLRSVSKFGLEHECSIKTPIKFSKTSNQVAAMLREKPQLRQSLGLLPPRVKQLLKENKYRKPRSDLELIYTLIPDSTQGRPDLSDRQPKSCQIIEAKCPHSFTPDVVAKALEAWRYYVSGWVDELDALPQDAIPLRLLLVGYPDALGSDIESVFSYITQLYHTMVNKRQTYGLLTAGVTSVMIKIDWKHTTEPGQHVWIRQVSAESGPESSDWNDANNRPTLQYILLCLALLQLLTGPVDEQVLQRLIQDYFDSIAAYRRSRPSTDSSRRSTSSSDDFEDPDDDDGAADEGSSNGGGRDRDHDANNQHQDSDSQGGVDELTSDSDNSSSSSSSSNNDHHRRQRKRRRTNKRSAADANSATSTRGLDQSNRAHRPSEKHLETLRGQLKDDKHKQILEDFFAPVDQSLCRVASPYELVHLAAELARRRKNGREVRSEDIDLLHPRWIIYGPLPHRVNRSLAKADRLSFMSDKLGRSTDRSSEQRDGQGALGDEKGGLESRHQLKRNNAPYRCASKSPLPTSPASTPVTSSSASNSSYRFNVEPSRNSLPSPNPVM